MAKKRRFRKLWFVCENNSVLYDKVITAQAYMRKENAETMAAQSRARSYMDIEKDWYPKDKQPPVYAVHGFYLVHESLYDEILKKHVEGD